MGTGSTIGIALLTTVAGGGAAFGLANILIQYLQISNREGASGYFALYITGFGLIGGFIVGIGTALVVQSGFWRAQGYALAIVLGLTLVAGILPLVFNDKGPTIDGDALVAEVELKFPPGWTPDNAAKFKDGSFCWLQGLAADAPIEQNPIVLGGLTLSAAPEVDGRWLVRCVMPLTKSSKNRFARIFVGHKTDVTLRLPIPRKPDRAYMQWSSWSSEGFLPQTGKPAATEYAARCRVQRETEYDREHPDPATVFQEDRKKALAAMQPDAPLAQWLPYFENERGQALAYSSGVYQEVEAVKAKTAELVPLLQSNDKTVVRRAIFATTALPETPDSLIEPLAAAGRLTVDLIRQARAGALPNDPDLAAEDRAYTFFFYWRMAMERAGPAGTRSFRNVLQEIDREARGSETNGGIHLIAEQARKDLDSPL